MNFWVNKVRVANYMWPQGPCRSNLSWHGRLGYRGCDTTLSASPHSFAISTRGNIMGKSSWETQMFCYVWSIPFLLGKWWWSNGDLMVISMGNLWKTMGNIYGKMWSNPCYWIEPIWRCVLEMVNLFSRPWGPTFQFGVISDVDPYSYLRIYGQTVWEVTIYVYMYIYVYSYIYIHICTMCIYNIRCTWNDIIAQICICTIGKYWKENHRCKICMEPRLSICSAFDSRFPRPSSSAIVTEKSDVRCARGAITTDFEGFPWG